jgi:hypothetical protein
MLYELENGNSTLAIAFLDEWEYDPALPCTSTKRKQSRSEELEYMVICSDSYDDPEPEGGLDWWDDCKYSQLLDSST